MEWVLVVQWDILGWEVTTWECHLATQATLATQACRPKIPEWLLLAQNRNPKKGKTNPVTLLK
jgi:hypothetical protein